MWNEIAKGFLGKNIVANLWKALGSIAALAVTAAMLGAAPSGLRTIASALNFFALPAGVGTAVRAVDEWFATNSTFTITVMGLLALLAALYLATGQYSRTVVPSGPAGSTFWIAMLGWQSTGFQEWGWSVTLFAAVIVALVVKQLIRGKSLDPVTGSLGLAVIELAVMIPYLVAWIVLAMIVPAHRRR